eukprot:scaffold3076_cov117-Isochrysis_galbana.AAC.14
MSWRLSQRTERKAAGMLTTLVKRSNVAKRSRSGCRFDTSGGNTAYPRWGDLGVRAWRGLARGGRGSGVLPRPRARKDDVPVDEGQPYGRDQHEVELRRGRAHLSMCGGELRKVEPQVEVQQEDRREVKEEGAHKRPVRKTVKGSPETRAALGEARFRPVDAPARSSAALARVGTIQHVKALGDAARVMYEVQHDQVTRTKAVHGAPHGRVQPADLPNRRGRDGEVQQ